METTTPFHDCRWKKGAAANPSTGKTSPWDLAWNNSNIHALLCLAKNASETDVEYIETNRVTGHHGKYTALHHLAQGQGWGTTRANKAALDEITEYFPELK